eukprot:489537_1
MTSSKKDIDPSIFTKRDRCDQHDQYHELNDCCAIQRITAVLTFVEQLNDNQESLQFITQTYPCAQLLNDKTHLITQHHDDIHQISTILPRCQLNQCSYSRRHYERKQNTEEQSETFYYDTIDNIHFYVHHLYDVGLRAHIEETKEKAKQKLQNVNCYDSEFDTKKQLIANKSSFTNTIPRLSVQNTKYIIIIGDNFDGELTFLDKLFDHMKAQPNISKFNTFLQEEEYDTDSLIWETIHIDYGNITAPFSEIIFDFQKHMQLTKTAFNVGIRFYYWIHYKYIEENINSTAEVWNQYHHEGFPICELYIKAKYKDFKHEIHEYKTINNIAMIYKDLVFKVYQYLRLENAQKMKATAACNKLHYGIEENENVSFHHLLSVILYTDETKLSTAFSSSFRATDPCEGITMIKQKNRKYWWMSKNLREVVELFGEDSCGLYDEDTDDFISQMSGPYYCGVKTVLKLSQFTTRLCAPTSTSTSIEVAIKFAHGDGAVIEFNTSNETYHGYLRGLNCSWLSRYAEEDERLFVGGNYPIAVQSVILMSCARNFEQFIHAFYCLDIAISGTLTLSDTSSFASKSAAQVIENMINYVLQLSLKIMEIDRYVMDTFNLFRWSKTEIILRLDEINFDLDPVMKNLIMTTMQETNHNVHDEQMRDDNANLFRKHLLQIFPNVTKLIIDSTSSLGKTAYLISLTSLLNLITNSRLKQVIIKATSAWDKTKTLEYNWILQSWKLSKSDITQMFLEKSYSIEKECINKCEGIEHLLIIKKKLIN